MPRKITRLLFLGLSIVFTVPTLASAASLRVTMKKHEPEFRACYQEESSRLKKRLSGRINLHVTVDKKGHAIEVTPAKNTTRSRALADCLVRKVESISFGKRKTAREVFIYPFKYSTTKP